LQNGPVIETTGGLVQGDTSSCGLFCNFFAFKGIPYAAPPVGDLRFSAPVPHPGWSGVKDATEHGNRCPSSGWLADYGGDEDCLFLNVYSRNLIGRRAVMVWIHGGSFTGGHGDTFLYGPDHLMTDDVVVVTINYRLGFLGFFSTGDAAASGNWGLKDAVQALRWVKENIARFGGDPDNVTIFGESAGGVAVHYLVLSEYANGLYHKAISQSGSALNPWAYQSNPARVADNLAQSLGLLYTSSQDLVDQLRNVHFSEFVIHQPGWLDIDKPRGFSSFDIAPCSEPFANGPVIIDHRTPMEIMQAGDFNDIPYISGYMSDESMFMQREHIIDDDIFRFFNDNPWAMVPELWNIPHSDPAVNEIAAAFRNLYFNGEAPNDDWMEQWTWVRCFLFK
jgi:bile salt-stimulated lipase